MNKRGIASSVVRILESQGLEYLNITEGIVERVYGALIEFIVDSLVIHGRIRLPDLGTFNIKYRAGRRVVGFEREEYKIKGYPIITFKATIGLPKKVYDERKIKVLDVDLSKPPVIEDDEF